MDITVSQVEGRVPITVFTISGPVISNVELEAQAQAAFDTGTRNILLDLTNVPYMATSGLRALNAIYMLLRTDSPDESDEAVKRGIRDGTFASPHLKLLKPSAKVVEALSVAGYDMFLQIHTDMHNAIASF